MDAHTKGPTDEFFRDSVARLRDISHAAYLTGNTRMGDEHRRFADEFEETREALRGCIAYRNWEIAEGGVVPDELRDTWKRAEAALSKARPSLTGGSSE